MGYAKHRQVFSDFQEHELVKYIQHASRIYFGLSPTEKGNTTEEMYQTHRARKDAAQAEKTQDKQLPATSRTKVLCMDVQRVLLSPALKASALYYKTKLQVHNYTIFDLTTRAITCYLWNESEGAMTANEFASCLFSYLEENRDTFDKVIAYSDGCTYQNRNRILATTLRHFCVKHQKTVEQKILEREHTQMAVDSVHATIERRLKNADIYSPLDYVQIVKAARTKPEPYEVRYLKFDFFRNFKKFGEGEVKSLKPGKDGNVTDMCAVRYEPDGTIHYKLNFVDDSATQLGSWQQTSHKRSLKLVYQQKKHQKNQILLKGTKFVVTENLTRRRNDFLKKVRSLETVSCAWTTDGRIVCLLEDGRKVTVLHERDVDTLSSGR